MKLKLLTCLTLGALAVGLASCDGKTSTPGPSTPPVSSTPPISTPTPSTPQPSTPTVVHVESVAVTAAKTTLEIGETTSLTVTVLPADADDKSVGYSSDTPAVATVSTDGVVTAVAAGKAVITATSTDGAKTGTVEITVNAADPFAVYDYYVNISDVEAKTIGAGTTALNDSFSVINTGKSVTIDESSGTLDDFTFTKRLKFGGSSVNSAGKEDRVISFTTTAKSTVDIFVKSATAGATDRAVSLYNTGKKWVEEKSAPVDELTKVTLTAHFAGTYYVSAINNINLYAIGVKTLTGEDTDFYPAQDPLKDSNVLDAGELIARTYTEPLTVGNFVLNATASKAIVVEPNSKTGENGTKYANRIKLLSSKDDATDHNSIKFTTTGSAKVVFYAMSSNTSSTRVARVIDSTGQQVGADLTITAQVNSIPGVEVQISAAGTYEFYSVADGINVWCIEIQPIA